MTPQQRLIMLGLMLGMVLNVFELSVVGTAMPRVVATLGGLNLYNWVFTAFMLTSTVTLPIFGKLGDLYGRKWVYISGLVLFMLGSVLCGMAHDMNFLIGARAVQGLGAGAMFPSAMAIVGEIFSPAERGRASSYFGPIFMAGGLLGPILGGFIVDFCGWQWVFWGCIPFGITTLLVMLAVLKAKPSTGEKIRLDLAGALLLAVAATPILLATKQLDEGANWSSFEVLGLVGLSLLGTIGFLIQERRAPEPILPIPMLKMPIFVVSAATEFLESGILMSITMLLPVMAQGVLGLSPSASGMLMTPYMFLLVLANMATGRLITKLGRYRILAISGFVLQSVGLVFLAILPPGGTGAHLVAGVVTAVGLGMLIPIYTIVVQNAVPIERIGSATAGMQFFTQMGEAIGVTAIGMVFTTSLTRSLAGMGGVETKTVTAIQELFQPMAIAKLNPAVVEQFRTALSHAFSQVYVIWAALAVTALLLTVSKLVDVPLRKDDDETEAPPEAALVPEV